MKKRVWTRGRMLRSWTYRQDTRRDTFFLKGEIIQCCFDGPKGWSVKKSEHGDIYAFIPSFVVALSSLEQLAEVAE